MGDTDGCRCAMDRVMTVLNILTNLFELGLKVERKTGLENKYAGAVSIVNSYCSDD